MSPKQKVSGSTPGSSVGKCQSVLRIQHRLPLCLSAYECLLMRGRKHCVSECGSALSGQLDKISAIQVQSIYPSQRLAHSDGCIR